MGVITLIRQVVLGTTALFSLIVMAISAHLTTESQKYFHVTFTFTALNVAVGVISLLTLPVMLITDLMRRGAFTSMIVVELAWLFILWVLWVAAAGEAASSIGRVAPNGCDFTNTVYNGMCQEVQAVEAFSFLNFIILLLYTGLLLTMAAIAANRGQNSVWLSSVKESFGSSVGPAEHPMTQYDTPAAAARQQAGTITGPSPGAISV